MTISMADVGAAPFTDASQWNDVSFFVPGLPAPKGSKKHLGRGRLVESCKTLPAWTKAVREAAQLAVQGIPADLLMVRQEPVAVDLTFVMRAPARMPKGRWLPSVPPDLDKLVRATLDALTKITYWDDGQVCDQRIRKVYGPETGCLINVTRIVQDRQASSSFINVQQPETALNDSERP